MPENGGPFLGLPDMMGRHGQWMHMCSLHDMGLAMGAIHG